MTSYAEESAALAPAARVDRREQDRQDRLVRARIEREREAARAQSRIAERDAAARARLDAAAARRAARAAARDERAARLARLAAWIGAHVVDLLFVPVIGVPALLSWTAMAAFGIQLYGVTGAALPAFSEGAMWAFAAAVTITRRRYPGRPVWHLRAGIAVFAVFGAALNFLHGLAAPSGLFPGLPAGILTGAVMALISVAGVVAHQLVTAGPRGKHRGDEPADESAPAVSEPTADERQDDEPGPVPGAEHNPASAVPAVDPAAAVDEPAAIEPAPVPVIGHAPVPTSAEHAAELAFRATHAAGNPLSGRQLEARFGLTRSEATKVRQRVLAELGEHPADDPVPVDAEPGTGQTAEPGAELAAV